MILTALFLSLYHIVYLHLDHPKFLNSEVKRYAIQGQPSILSCTVIDSSPPIRHLSIMRGQDKIVDDLNHKVAVLGPNTIQLKVDYSNACLKNNY